MIFIALLSFLLLLNITYQLLLTIYWLLFLSYYICTITMLQPFMTFINDNCKHIFLIVLEQLDPCTF